MNLICDNITLKLNCIHSSLDYFYIADFFFYIYVEKSVKMSTTASKKVLCYLCDMPRFPWAMLTVKVLVLGSLSDLTIFIIAGVHRAGMPRLCQL